MPGHIHVLTSSLVSVLRCILAGVFPLFGEKLFQKLGVDWGVALLAFLVLGVGLPLITLVRVECCLITVPEERRSLICWFSCMFLGYDSVLLGLRVWRDLKDEKRVDSGTWLSATVLSKGSLRR
jgi:hypothetical protein